MSTPSPSRQQVEFDSDQLDVRLHMRFAADIEKVAEMAEPIMQIVRTMECACGEEGGIELSLHEALANAIRHGAGNDPSKTIEVKVACDADHGMLIVVADPGQGFDPREIADPLQGENVFSDHGRGIFLINRLMDQVEFKRGGTEIHMRKFKKPSGDSSQ